MQPLFLILLLLDRGVDISIPNSDETSRIEEVKC